MRPPRSKPQSRMRLRRAVYYHKKFALQVLAYVHEAMVACFRPRKQARFILRFLQKSDGGAHFFHDAACDVARARGAIGQRRIDPRREV